MISTKVTEDFGLVHPIFSAGMARVSQAPLVAAVSAAGGMGCLGGVTFMPEALRAEIEAIRKATDRPFAVNIFPPEDEDAEKWRTAREAWGSLPPVQRAKLAGIEPMLTPGVSAAQLDVVLETRPAALVLTFGVPRHVVERCQARGIKVMALCGSVGAAITADAAGVDYIIAQGAEGGGHTGHVGSLALVPTVIDAVKAPVIAAGGIVDGRGLAAALCLGAEAVWCGTRFIASAEAFGHPAYKQRVTSASARDTTLTTAYTGKNLRALRNDWTALHEDDRQKRSFPAQYAIAGQRVETGYQDGDLAEGMMPAGQGLGLVRDILPAREILSRMTAEAERVLKAKSGLCG